MPYFESYNDNGGLQLSADNPVLTLVSSGTATTTSSFNSSKTLNSICAISVNPVGNAPMIAVAPAGFVSLLGSSPGSILLQCDMPIGASIPFWYFDNVPVSSSGLGLEIFDAAGNLIYALGKRPFRVAKVVSTSDTGNHVFTGGRSYAIAFSNDSYSTTSQQIDTYDSSRPFSMDITDARITGVKAKSINSGFQLANRFISSLVFNGSQKPAATKPSGMMMMDVTDYGSSAAPGGSVNNASASCSPNYQLGRDNVLYHTYDPVSVSVSNAPSGISEYRWYIFGDTNNGDSGNPIGYSIDGQGTATAQVTLFVATDLPQGYMISGELKCRVTFADGNNIYAASTLTYVYTGGSSGGGGGGGGGGSLSIAPPSSDNSGSSANFNFPQFTANSSPAASSYNWTVTGQSGGSFSIISGQGTATATPRVSGVAPGGIASADLVCDAVINGVTKSASASLSYSYVSSGGTCVAANSHLPDGRLAHDVRPNDTLLVLNYTDMDSTTYETVESAVTAKADCVRLTSRSGITLVASKSTPITLRDGSMPNIKTALGKELPVMDQDGFRWEEITSVEEAGLREVSHITCHGATYAAGEQPDRFIFTHNIQQKDG